MWSCLLWGQFLALVGFSKATAHVSDTAGVAWPTGCFCSLAGRWTLGRRAGALLSLSNLLLELSRIWRAVGRHLGGLYKPDSNSEGHGWLHLPGCVGGSTQSLWSCQLLPFPSSPRLIAAISVGSQEQDHDDCRASREGTRRGH